MLFACFHTEPKSGFVFKIIHAGPEFATNMNEKVEGVTHHCGRRTLLEIFLRKGDERTAESFRSIWNSGQAGLVRHFKGAWRNAFEILALQSHFHESTSQNA